MKSIIYNAILFAILGCAPSNPLPETTTVYCGNGVCDFNEGCDTCSFDCGLCGTDSSSTGQACEPTGWACNQDSDCCSIDDVCYDFDTTPGVCFTPSKPSGTVSSAMSSSSSTGYSWGNCGDGHCDMNENGCNCPSDCKDVCDSSSSGMGGNSSTVSSSSSSGVGGIDTTSSLISVSSSGAGGNPITCMYTVDYCSQTLEHYSYQLYECDYCYIDKEPGACVSEINYDQMTEPYQNDCQYLINASSSGFNCIVDCYTQFWQCSSDCYSNAGNNTQCYNGSSCSNACETQFDSCLQTH